MKLLLFLALLGLASPAMAGDILAPALSGIQNTDDLAQYLNQSGRRILYEKSAPRARSTSPPASRPSGSSSPATP